MAVGITQPGGAGTTIFIYDNASAPDTIAYHFADIATAFPADFVDNGTFSKSYRSKVSVQLGDTGAGTATTTLQDTNATVLFDSGKGIIHRVTQTTSWNLNLGTKVGTGNQATGRNGCVVYTSNPAALIRGNYAIYGTTWIHSASSVFQLHGNVAGLTTEAINCIFGHTGTTSSSIAIGGAGFPVTNFYNVDFWGNASAANTGVLTNFNASAAERITIGGPSMPAILRTPSGTVLMKDTVFFGSPTVADIVISGTPSSWDIVRPKWSGNAPKFAPALVAAGIIRERWIWDVKLVDVSGHAVSGVTVKLTDSTGAAQVDTTTDATGQVSFGSGLLQNAAVVRDHYGDGVSYLTRDRSPFLVEIGGNLIRYYFDWPGISTGNFEDISDVIPLQYASGGPTTWTEMSI